MPTTSTDYNLVFGWNVQNSEPSAGAANGPGTTPAGYAQAGVAPQPPAVTVGQVGSGTVNSAIGPLGGPAGNSPILENPGYADGTGTFLGQLTTTTQPVAPIIAYATRVNNPSGLAASVTVTGGSVTGIYVGPLGVGGGTGTTNLTQITSGPGTVTVPPAGVIYVTGSGGAWTWITQN